jgi:hypothetical protein
MWAFGKFSFAWSLRKQIKKRLLNLLIIKNNYFVEIRSLIHTTHNKVI